MVDLSVSSHVWSKWEFARRDPFEQGGSAVGFTTHQVRKCKCGASQFRISGVEMDENDREIRELVTAPVLIAAPCTLPRLIIPPSA